MRRIALLTDFGSRDPYVAAMKGVIAARTDAPIHDLTHDIAPFDVWEGAFFLRAVLPYWRHCVIVAVVDPGVGTSRKMLAVIDGDRIVLGPDNGLLHFVEGAAFAIEDASIYLPQSSNTFHGRDRFAPAAAAIANGFDLERLGPRIEQRVPLDYQPGCIIAIDRFGNAITDLAPAPNMAVEVNGRRIDRLERNYGDAAPGAFLIVGSNGTIEISVKNGSAAEALGLTRGMRVAVLLAG
ncbi:MAG TPA: SAM-dependent chlorinase/fluorinase [Thermoanaerobaculia bacterium]|jgi:hypothetical protein